MKLPNLRRFWPSRGKPAASKPTPTLSPQPTDTSGSFRELTENEMEWIRQNGTCPFCGGALYEGPTGGLSINFACVDGCRNKVNLCIAPGFGVFGGQYIGKLREGEA